MRLFFLFIFILSTFFCDFILFASEGAYSKRRSEPTVNFSPRRRLAPKHQSAVKFYPESEKKPSASTRNFKAQNDAESTGPQVRPRRKNKKVSSPLHQWRKNSFYKQASPFRGLQSFDNKLEEKYW
ncbi:MAG: hypothetical protein PHV17_05565 [Candidatus Omnitrophica bacterium]|nr:hypothetical protein [Candidatus Omnitrophota bacterium]